MASTESESSTENTTLQVPEAIAEPRRRRRFQLVWIIPIIATIIGLSLMVKAYMERGQIVTIIFASGEGLEPGKTRIKYKDVQIGEVKNIAIAKDRSHVIVTAEVNRQAVPLMVEDTRFWVVRARISGGSVSGLNTLMGGSYIGVDAGKSTVSKFEFKGLDRAPVVTQDVPGTRYLLHATDIGSLDVSSPVFYRRIQVGEVTAYQLDKDGKGVSLNIFVRAPYDQYVKSSTMFWHASGIDVSMDANGIKVNTESIVSIMVGGIAFQAAEDKLDSQPAAANAVFTLFNTHDEALKRPDTVVETYTLLFKESVRGLPVGAPVDLRGVTVGEVSRIDLELDPARNEFSMPVEIKFYPERLRARYRNSSKKSKLPVNTRELLNSLVEHGFRAQLRSGSLLTGQLFVALDLFPKAAPAKMDWSKNPPEFPTMQNSFEQFQTAVMQIVQKIEKLPLDELANDSRKAVQSLDATLKSADMLIKNMDSVIVPEARIMIEDVRSTLKSVRTTVDSAKKNLDADSPLQLDMRETMRELQRAARALKTLAEYLEQHPESLIQGKKGGK